MKKIALALTLLLGAAMTNAQDLPRFAQPQNEAEKPYVERAIADANKMKSTLHLDKRQFETVLEINCSAERRSMSVINANPQDKQAQLAEIENWRWKMYEGYVEPGKLDKYKRGLEKK
ncbi:MAG: hypothetical protein JST52_04740 [Bacteroidetes bacterium]|nr:hypothetical protein [Bacteroidota bacterium]MBS1739844.1 hypothetical protein [Bacteroidota bacterium]MBS1776931.1 hypothetical protein [Bacteroidota bacterium]